METPHSHQPFAAIAQWILARAERTPCLIGVCGSVSVGKSTFCEALLSYLRDHPTAPGVDIVSTDGFLLPNRELEARGLMHRKGFPESYDTDAMRTFFDTIRRTGSASVSRYSHEVYDVTHQTQTVQNAGIVLVEGVAAMLIPGTLDASIYLDAAEEDIERWFLIRVQQLRREAAPDTFYWHFRQLPDGEFMSLAQTVWRDVNLQNLWEHILPNREVADLVVRKGRNHELVSLSELSSGGQLDRDSLPRHARIEL